VETTISHSDSNKQYHTAYLIPINNIYLNNINKEVGSVEVQEEGRGRRGIWRGPKVG